MHLRAWQLATNLLFIGKDNTTLSVFPNYSGHGSRYSVLGIFFSLLSTPRPPKNMFIIPNNLWLLTHFWAPHLRYKKSIVLFRLNGIYVALLRYDSIFFCFSASHFSNSFAPIAFNTYSPKTYILVLYN